MSKNNSEAFAIRWDGFFNQFTGKPVSMNFKEFVKTNTNESRSDVYTHYIHSYPAKMFPYIPLFFYSVPQLCSPDGVVLDPFCGSGTTLLESLIHPVFPRDSLGVEINPIGRLIAKVKTTPIDTEILQDKIGKIKKRAKTFSGLKPNVTSKKLKFWFSESAIIELNKIKCLIEEQEDSFADADDFLWLSFSSIVRRASLADPFIPPPVLLKLSKYEKTATKYMYLSNYLNKARKPSLTNAYFNSIEKNFDRLQQINKKLYNDKSAPKASIIWDNAKQIKSAPILKKGILKKDRAKPLGSKSVDLILTSPPYLTAQKYVRTLTLELLWLDLLNEKEIGCLDRETIGTERSPLKEANISQETNIKSVDDLVKWSLLKSRERSVIILNYFLGMQQSISEMYRVLKNDSYAIIVIGNNEVLGRKVETYSLIIDIAISAGFKLELVLVDKIRGRGMITRRHETGGLIKDEYAIVLKKC
jgi:DNA modification methylase